MVCVDGFDPTYLADGLDSNTIPTLGRFVRDGFHTTAKSAMPSFTNPNNVSIITGASPSIHGIAGNFFLDRESGTEEMITDASLLRGSTILAEMSKRGVRVAAVTAKDKLRRILSHGVELANGSVSFSAEAAASCSLGENGVENVEEWIGRAAPSQYSGDLSIFVLDAGVKLVEENRADLLYLTLSDYIQHKHAPGSVESNAFLADLDHRLNRLAELGATVAITGDHGMSQKSGSDGSPNVVFLGDELDRKFGSGGDGGGWGRVICPITDPFVRHHGALGSFARVYLTDVGRDLEPVLDFCRSLPCVEEALAGREAAERYEMPADREADVVVISTRNAVIGSKESEHDLSKVMDHPLRSHGGLSEQEVPLIVSRPVRESGAREWKNYDVFDLALNLAV